MTIPRLFLCISVLLAALAAPANAHEGEVHAEPAPPKSPAERLATVFTGNDEGRAIAVDPVAVERAVQGGKGGTSQTKVTWLYTPDQLRVGRTAPIRVQLDDASAGIPLTGYSPELTIRFESGKELKAGFRELAELPGLYELIVPWQEAGATKLHLGLGKGDNALVSLEETVYVKRPVVPLAPYLIIGLVLAVIAGSVVASRSRGGPRVAALVVAVLVPLVLAVGVRQAMGSGPDAIAAAESAALQQAGAKEGAEWPNEVAVRVTPTSTEDPASTSTNPDAGADALIPGVPKQDRVIGRLVIPDDARALISAPQGGTLTSKTILPRGAHVRKGQTLATLRVLNTEVAPEAASATGDVSEAEARLGQAEIALRQTERDLLRGRELYAAEAISKRELEERENAVEAAQLERDSAQQAVAATKQRAGALRAAGGSGPYRTVTLTSPIDGVITAVEVSAGQYAEEGAPLYTIVAPGRLWLEAQLFEDQIQNLTPDAVWTFTLPTDPTVEHRARFRSRGLEFDSESRTLPVLFDVVAPSSALVAGQQVLLVPPVAKGAGNDA